MGQAKRRGTLESRMNSAMGLGKITTRELAEAIDALIRVRVQQSTFVDFQSQKDGDERAEICIRLIADGLRQHSGASGIYAE